MLAGITALKKKPVFVKPEPIRPSLLSTGYVPHQENIDLFLDRLGSTSKERNFMLRLPLSKSGIENIIAYLYQEGVIEKIPYNPKNIRHGMSYKLKEK